MSSRNVTLVVGALVVLIILSAANLYVLLSSDRSGSDDSLSAEQLAPIADPIFVKIGPLTVNLRSDRYGERLLYTTLSLRVENESTQEIIKKFMPEVQSRLLVMLSSYTAEQLTTPEGKQEVARAVLQALETPLVESQPRLAISAVLFTDFIVQ